MNRVIKFRGKRLTTKEWIFGYYGHSPIGNWHTINSIDNGYDYFIDPETLCQLIYTNPETGQEFYEWDIVELKSPRFGTIKGIIYYNPTGRLNIEIDSSNYFGLDRFHFNTMTLIGNKFEQSK